MIYIVYNEERLHYFIEYVTSIAKYYPITLVNSNEEVTLKENDLLWFLQFVLRNDLVEKYPYQVYLINTEQNTKKENIDLLNSYAIPILDYSLENIRIASKKNHYYLPYMINVDEVYDLKKTNDIIVLSGGVRRAKIALALGSSWLQNNWGEERDAILFRHKILVNIHYADDYNVLEELRINRCIYNKMIVITEKSGNLDYYDLKDYIIVCDYNDIVKVAKDVLENYEYYYNKLFNNFDIIQHSIHRKAIADVVVKNDT